MCDITKDLRYYYLFSVLIHLFKTLLCTRCLNTTTDCSSESRYNKHNIHVKDKITTQKNVQQNLLVTANLIYLFILQCLAENATVRGWMTNRQTGLRPVFQSFRENATIHGAVTHLMIVIFQVSLI